MFVPLHVHSEYSLQESPTAIKDLITKAVSLGFQSLALTDHNTMAGHVEFYDLAIANQIKPILGIEVDINIGEAVQQLVLLAKDNQGYRNLLTIASKPKPISLGNLTELNSGLIGLVAFQEQDQAQQVFDQLESILGEGNAFVEVQIDNSSKRQMANWLVKNFNEKVLVAGQNVYYLEQYEEDVARVLQAAKYNSKIDLIDPGNPLLSKNDIINAFKQFPQLVRNSSEIANQCDVQLNHNLQLPKLPEKFDLAEMTETGARKLYPEFPAIVRERLEQELTVITSMGLSDYFLIVADIVNYARRNKIPVGPGRGSAAGSLVAYCLGITQVDPLKHNLLFERFLNKQRQTLPDIDLDICSLKRDQLVDYVIKRFGEQYVAKIGTYGTYGEKAAQTDVLKYMGKPNPPVEKLLIGVKQYFSTHAAGLIIAPEPVIHYSGLENDGINITQLSMDGLERLGLVKIDLLGLRNLTILSELEQKLQQTNPSFSLAKIPLDDQDTFDLLATGDTLGIFQLESEMFQQILPRFRVKSFSDLVALLALGRPGPLRQIPDYIKRRDGDAQVQYLHPKLKTILADTYGLIIYQEQVMKIAHEIAGFSLEESDLFRVAISKKDRSLMAKMETKFIDGCVANGISNSVGSKLFAQLRQFADYAFNKAHSTAYAYITWNLAYLKTHYPLEFYQVQLKHTNKSDKLKAIYHECIKRGIKILPPDVRYSYSEPVIEGDSLRIGFNNLRNIGRVAANQIVMARSDRNFKNLADFSTRVQLQERTKLSLIYGGAFDGLGDRKKMILQLTEPSTSISDWELLQQEQEIVGIYVSNHPVTRWESFLASLAPSLGFNVAGEISSVHSDNQGLLGTVINHGSGYDFRLAKGKPEFARLIQPNALLALFGDLKDNLLEVEWVLPLKRILVIQPDLSKITDLQQFLAQNKGDTPVLLNIDQGIFQVIAPRFWLNVNDEITDKLQSLCKYIHWIDPWKSRYL